MGKFSLLNEYNTVKLTKILFFYDSKCFRRIIFSSSPQVYIRNKKETLLNTYLHQYLLVYDLRLCLHCYFVTRRFQRLLSPKMELNKFLQNLFIRIYFAKINLPVTQAINNTQSMTRSVTEWIVDWIISCLFLSTRVPSNQSNIWVAVEAIFIDDRTVLSDLLVLSIKLYYIHSGQVCNSDRNKRIKSSKFNILLGSEETTLSIHHCKSFKFIILISILYRQRRKSHWKIALKEHWRL